ncbi:ABC-2 type transport system ATP-binding protein [Paenibacillus forsythiae]|uniref:ABC-2 type transport system ATP-binding protein n=1 Tax=Paenibacillus forsythiae TaxID=365616 RepID=A0ABU3HDR2_9BACL|nr:ABC transporter ATP-binding protein [Paenibacillus forsythiae]MDT3428177.1 ABC-2 type transport system ATP-binding protein [Paenibacillus forsythiae]
METIIQTTDLVKRYRGRMAVDHLDLSIGKGEIYGFLGPNGAGKTTTIRMLLGLIAPTGGYVEIFGKDLRKERLDILRRVGSLVESPSYYGHLSAVENLEAIRRILGAPKRRIAEVLDIVSLTGEEKRPVKGFSLGMKQRLGIAAALLGSPELLILDEPTNGLDPSGIQEIRSLIMSLPREHGITVLVSSHLLSEIEQMAGTVGIIRQGRMIYQDTIAHLRQRSAGEMRLVVSEPEAALEEASRRGYDGMLRTSELRFSGMNDAQVALLVKALVEQGHAIYRVEEQRQSLEEFFLQVVEREGR